MEEVGETLLDEENTKEDKTVEAALSWAKTSRRSCCQIKQSKERGI